MTFSREKDPLEQLHKGKFRLYVADYTGRANGRANAEDVVQEAFFNACKGIKTFDPAKGSLATWFEVVLRNTFFRWMSKESKGGITLDINELELEDYRVDLDRLVLYNDVKGHILDTTRGESESVKRRVLVGFFLEQKTARQVAEEVGVSLDSVKGCLKRYRDTAKKRFM